MQNLVKIDKELWSASASQTISNSTAADSSEARVNTVDAVKSQLDKMRSLRYDVDRVRSMVTDKLAEDMGRRLTCNPQ